MTHQCLSSNGGHTRNTAVEMLCGAEEALPSFNAYWCVSTTSMQARHAVQHADSKNPTKWLQPEKDVADFLVMYVKISTGSM